MPRQRKRTDAPAPISISRDKADEALVQLPTLPAIPPVALAVTPSQGAKLLQIGYRQFYGLLMSGEIASFTIGRSRRVPVTAIEAFIQDRLQVEAHQRGFVLSATPA